tara:strand:+ start:225 stop:470 length:246 start_codon:yes stop_codon:yes gene_type:complete
MNKYYVKSGNLQVIILGEDERDAIARALEYSTSTGCKDSPSVTLDDFFYANERGFSSMDESDFRMNTEEVILDLMDWEWEE